MKKQNKKLFILFSGLIFSGLSFMLVLANRENIGTSLVARYYGASSQCVGFIQRYYQSIFNIDLKNIGSAQNIFSLAGEFGLYARENGGKIVPQPGDILVFGHQNEIGHVSIITDVFREGVKIIEQNWGTSGITTNNNKLLKMEVVEGRYSIQDRDAYKVIGWVSRVDGTPDGVFDFTDSRSNGWYPENNVFVDYDRRGFLVIEPRGENPTIASPINMGKGLIKQPKKVDIRFNIENKQGRKGRGIIYLRDQNDDWTEGFYFDVGVNNGFQIYSINLEDLPEDFEVVQLRLILNDNPEIKKEKWEIDWLQFY